VQIEAVAASPLDDEAVNLDGEPADVED
jgi:hypothetical protein